MNLIGGIGDIALGAVNTGYNIFANERARGDSRNDEMYRRQSAETAQKWQEFVTRENWNRDDTSYQRRAADLQAAGLHPTLALGGASAATPSMPSAATPGPGSSSNMPIDRKSSILQTLLMSEQVKSAQAQTAMTQAETDRINAETADIRENTANRPKEQTRADAYLHLAEQSQDIASTDLGLRTERHGVDMSILRGQLQRQPEEFIQLQLDNQLRRGELSQQHENLQQSRLNQLETQQRILLTKMQQSSELIRQISMEAGITNQELQNRILLADAEYNERYRQPSTRANEYEAANIFLRDVLGIDPQSQAGGKVRTHILMTDYLLDIGLRILGSNKLTVRRNTR